MDRTHLMVIQTDRSPAVRPGQFAMLACGHSHEHMLRRPVSFFDFQPGKAAFLFSIVGAGTAWLAERHPGETLDVLGAFGNGFSINAGTRHLLLVAGGIGIAPLLFLARHSISRTMQITILAGARTARQLCPDSLIPTGCNYWKVTEDGSVGEKGLVTALLPRFIGWADQICVCGPLPMLKAVAADYGPSLNHKSVQVSLEVRMGCGFGYCYACTIRTATGLRQVCHDGPIFPLDEVIWDELK